MPDVRCSLILGRGIWPALNRCGFSLIINAPTSPGSSKKVNDSKPIHAHVCHLELDRLNIKATDYSYRWQLHKVWLPLSMTEPGCSHLVLHSSNPRCYNIYYSVNFVAMTKYSRLGVLFDSRYSN